MADARRVRAEGLGVLNPIKLGGLGGYAREDSNLWPLAPEDYLIAVCLATKNGMAAPRYT